MNVNQAVGLAVSEAKKQAPMTALDAMALASKRRVDFVMIGDSQQLFNGYGFGGAFAESLAARFGLYASQICNPYLSGNGGGGGSSWTTFDAVALAGSTTPTTADGTTTGVDATLADFSMPQFVAAEGTPSANYGFVASGSSLAAGTTGGCNSAASIAGVDLSARWRVWYAYGTFSTGTGSFKVEARMASSPYTTLASGSLINTNTGAETNVLGSLDIAAGAASGKGIEARWSKPGGAAITGPFIGYFMRLENLDAESGVSVSTLYGIGGQSLYDMAYQMQNVRQKFLTNYFSEVRRLQLTHGLKPIVVIYIDSGVNDRNETSQPSLGWRANTTANSDIAYRDNMEALISAIYAVWDANGWDRRELFWFIMPSQPQPSDTVIPTYTAQVSAWSEIQQADKRIAQSSLVDLSKITSADEITALNGWDVGGPPHLTSAMYKILAQRVVNLIPTLS